MRQPLGHKIQVALTRFHCALWSHKGVQEKEQCEIYLWTNNGKIMLKVNDIRPPYNPLIMTHEEFENHLDQISNC